MRRRQADRLGSFPWPQVDVEASTPGVCLGVQNGGCRHAFDADRTSFLIRQSRLFDREYHAAGPPLPPVCVCKVRTTGQDVADSDRASEDKAGAGQAGLPTWNRRAKMVGFRRGQPVGPQFRERSGRETRHSREKRGRYDMSIRASGSNVVIQIQRVHIVHCVAIAGDLISRHGRKGGRGTFDTDSGPQFVDQVQGSCQLQYVPAEDDNTSYVGSAVVVLHSHE